MTIFLQTATFLRADLSSGIGCRAWLVVAGYRTWLVAGRTYLADPDKGVRCSRSVTSLLGNVYSASGTRSCGAAAASLLGNVNTSREYTFLSMWCSRYEPARERVLGEMCLSWL